MKPLDPYFKVRINTLVPNKTTTFDLFVQAGGHPILYLRAGDRLEADKIKALQAKDSGSSFWVPETQRKEYKTYVHDQMTSNSLNVGEKALVLRESSITMVEELFENPDIGKALDNAKPVIEEFVAFMKAEPEGMAHLISLSGHDFYTYNHSLDVSIYSLGLGEAMGYDKKDLEELGIAALFHDIGKRQVALEILCKKGPLDAAEWAQMQQHPQFGYVLLEQQPNVSDAVKAACFEHHEAWSGNGYPQKLSGQEIHPFARIVSLTDTYDALTTQRSYNVPMKPIDAVTMMRDKIRGKYDPEMLKAMHSVLFKLKPAA